MKLQHPCSIWNCRLSFKYVVIKSGNSKAVIISKNNLWAIGSNLLFNLDASDDFTNSSTKDDTKLVVTMMFVPSIIALNKYLFLIVEISKRKIFTHFMANPLPNLRSRYFCCCGVFHAIFIKEMPVALHPVVQEQKSYYNIVF